MRRATIDESRLNENPHQKMWVIERSNTGPLAEIPIKTEEVAKTLTHGLSGSFTQCDGSSESKIQEVKQEINSYSINLMWINKTLNPNQKYLSSAKNDDDLKNKLLSPVIKWAMANPTAEVSLWYDSTHVTSDAIKNTEKVLKEQLREKGLENVRLRDVREIPIVKANPDAFSDQIPIYFRVDMFKPIIIVHSIESEKKDAAVFTDMEVGDQRPNRDRMGKDELFEPSAMKTLNDYGLVLNNDSGRAENQFLQLMNNKRMISAIKHAMINPNLERAEYALNHPDKEDWVPALGRAGYVAIQQDVFNYYNGTVSGGVIKVRPDVIGRGKQDDPWIDYYPEEHGYAPFGKAFMPRMNASFVVHQDGETFERPEHVIQSSGKRVGLNSPSRKVDVRNGNDHSTDWSDLTPRPPANGENTYRVQFWK